MRRWGAASVGALLLSIALAGAVGAYGDQGTPAGPAAGGGPAPGDARGPLPFNDPAWTPGHFWKYDVVYELSGGGQFIDLKGDTNTSADSPSNVTIGNVTHQTLKLTNTGGGNAAGNISMGNFTFPFRGPWTLTGVTHVLRNSTDEVQIDQKIVLVDTATNTRITVYELSNYSPALTNLEFPMDSTTKWTYNGQHTRYNWTHIQSVQGSQYLAAPSTSVTNESLPFKTVGPFYKTVPAGTYYCLQVTNGTAGARRLAQPLPGAAEQFYSDGAGNAVQIEFQDQQGAPIGYFNLSKTNYKPPAGKYGSQGGFVKDKAGNGLNGAKVTAKPASGPTATDYTDAQGRFDFTNLDPGQYTLLANLSGYVDDQKIADVKAQPAQNADVILTLLKPTGTLSITTQDETGAALGNTSVRIVGPGVDLTNKTDAAGVYSIEVGIGTYNVTGSKTGYKPATKTGVQVLLQQATSVTLQLEKLRGSVAGKITDLKSGFAVVGAKVTVSKAGTMVAETVTDVNGSFKFDKLDPGTYMVTAAATGYSSQSDNVSVVGGQERAKNFILQKVPPPPDNTQGISALVLYGAIGGVLVAVVLVVLLMMMRAKKKKAAEEAAKRQRPQGGPQEPQW